MIYILSNREVEGAISLPLIEQYFLTPPINVEGYDYLIFTSKNGVVGIDRIDRRWRGIPALVIGAGTAAKVRELGGEVAYQARNSYGDLFAQEIGERFDPTKSYLYPRGRKVLSNLVPFLRERGFSIDEAIVYETRCLPCGHRPPPPPGSVIIFSSPSTIQCFFRCFDWDKSYRAVAIGEKTAAYFPYSIAVSPSQTLRGAVEFARQL
ncbi:MAG: uroporphyrinogen-III synthase [Epsilonproteobacteria bacterium]|nr:hypothetical protein [Campylobacterota bacterium]NPA56492.1 uroporphyrinogen-III synthase [Campylobacterota bacterium]